MALGEPGYPPALAQVDGPPPLLYVKGRLDLADAPIVAIVGARNGSAIGQKFTRQIASALGLEGFAVASGLARGIDTAAHTAALDHGTIAVVAGGIDIRPRTKRFRTRLASAAFSSASARRGSLRGARTSPAATG